MFEIDAQTMAEKGNGQVSVTVAGRMNAFEAFVRVQSDAALRQVAGEYAYDDNEHDKNELTLRGGVGWGEVINGGFGMLLDGSADADRRLKNMLFWDVNNGISRRSWARNEGAVFAIKRAMEANPNLKVTLPNYADDQLVESLF